MRRSMSVVAATVLLLACGDDDGSGRSRSSSAADSLTALLGSVPDTSASRGAEIYYTNLDRVRAGQPAVSEGVDDFSNLLRARSYNLWLPARYGDCFGVEECVAELGFDTRVITAAIEFGELPDRAEVLVGEFSAADVQSSLEASPAGSGTRAIAFDGATMLSLGTEGQASIVEISAFRPVGRGITIGIGGPGLVSADQQALVESVLTVEQTDSLAADPAYASVARALDAAEVDVAIITPAMTGSTWLLGGMGEVTTGDDELTTPDPAVVTYVFVFADEAGAQAGGTAFRTIVDTGQSALTNTAWSERLTVIDSAVDGAVLVVTLQTAESGWWIQPLVRQDTLLQF